jgi:hypothetical protein
MKNNVKITSVDNNKKYVFKDDIVKSETIYRYSVRIILTETIEKYNFCYLDNYLHIEYKEMTTQCNETTHNMRYFEKISCGGENIPTDKIISYLSNKITKASKSLKQKMDKKFIKGLVDEAYDVLRNSLVLRNINYSIFC